MARNNSPSKSVKLKQILKFLSVRARSEKEVRDRLSKYGLTAADIETEVDRLKKWKLIDDAEFAKLYAESRSRSRPRSSWLINLELKRKGVTTNYQLPATDLELAKLALEKKKNLKSAQQAVNFLKSRGFNWETIEKAIKNKYNETHVN